MSKVIDLTGQKFNRWTVIKYHHKNKYRSHFWLCKCDCGNQTIVRGDNLKGGATKSCGCLRKESLQLNPHNLKHGHTTNDIISETYTTWQKMNQRCHNPNVSNYKNYGGRGIKVCKKWRKFEGFFQDMGERPPGLTLDRVDNDRDYCKANCKWSTPKEQARNTRRNKTFIINGVNRCLAEWCEIYNLAYYLVKRRIYNGWTIEEALEIVPRKRKTKTD